MSYLKRKNQYNATDVLKNIAFEQVFLTADRTFGEKEMEVLVVLLSGEVAFSVEGQDYCFKRADVFTDLPQSVYIPSGQQVTFRVSDRCELAICKTASTKGGPVVVISKENLTVEQRGKNGFRRAVCDIINEAGASEFLVVGETINCNGEWSSYPPHKHDETSEKECEMEELYLFKLNPENGFGFQRIYTEDGSLDETMTIHHNDITLIPKGYHPVAVMPGHQIYYLWVLVGKQKKLMPRTQEIYEWLL